MKDTEEVKKIDNQNEIKKKDNKEKNKVEVTIEEKVENKLENTNKKSNFVPAYERKKKEIQDSDNLEKEDKVKEIKKDKKEKTKEKKNSKVKNKEDKKDKKESKQKDTKPIIKSKISVIILAIIALVVILTITLSVIYIFNNENIDDYGKLMDDYGLTALYNNQSSNPSEKVTKSEAVKMVIATTLNTEDITNYMPNSLLYKQNETAITESENGDEINLDELFNRTDSTQKIEEEYTNEYWIRYAKSIEFLTKDEITIDNYNDEVTYLEMLTYISKAKTILLGQNLDVEKEPNFKNYNEYDNTTKLILADLVYNGIIEDKSSKLDDNKIVTKDIVNQLVISHVLKYNLITVDDEKININELKMPSNKDEFAYTVASVDKKAYEIENYKASEDYKNARELFATIKRQYEDINILVENYYNTLLNIDYTTITPESLYAILTQSTMYMLSEQEIQEYVEYVKTNQIKITGEAQVQNPIIYFDGYNYRVRTKLTYDIQASNNLQNIFFYDTESEYKLGKDEIYIDVPIRQNISMSRYYVVPTSIADMIAGSVK